MSLAAIRALVSIVDSDRISVADVETVLAAIMRRLDDSAARDPLPAYDTLSTIERVIAERSEPIRKMAAFEVDLRERDRAKYAAKLANIRERRVERRAIRDAAERARISSIPKVGDDGEIFMRVDGLP